ncbi:MAG: hypothetical protein WDW38_003212 [Sanguina aurantia]
MVKKTKGSHRLDKYYHLAKEQGYRSRAAFKLIQLNRKYSLLESCRAVLDLCAAPGGWLQVASKTLPLGSLMIGVDLAPIKPIRGVKCLLQDITTTQCRAAIKKEAAGSMFDLVLHDGAPNVGGVWQSEAYTQSALVLDSLKLATEFLAPQGTFVTKVFRSKDYNALLYAFNQLFDKVESTKPLASRGASAEIFVVCQGYKAPSKIDPRLLDARHLFQEISEVKKVMGPEALLRQKITQKRHREGYEEGLSTLRKVTSATAFLASINPVEMLGQFTAMALDGTLAWIPVEGVAGEIKEVSHAIRTHKATTPEIVALCKDLQVLGRSEFKLLLKWRLQLKKELKSELEGGEREDGKDKGAKAAAAAAAALAAMDPEEALLAEMAGIQEGIQAREKRERKKRRELKIKARVRAAQMAQSEGVLMDEQQGPDSLFNLGSFKGKGKLSGLLDSSAPAEDEMEVLAHDSDEDLVGGISDDESGGDSDDDALRYEARTEEAMEESYRTYLERKGVRDAAVKEKRKRLGMDGELEDDEEGGGGEGKEGVDITGPSTMDDEEEEEDADDVGGLLVGLDDEQVGVRRTGAAVAAQWFKQDMFNDPGDAIDDDAEEGEDGEPKQSKKKAKAAAKAAGKGAAPAGQQQQQEEDASTRGGSSSRQAGSSQPSAMDEDDDEEEEGPLSEWAYGMRGPASNPRPASPQPATAVCVEHVFCAQQLMAERLRHKTAPWPACRMLAMVRRTARRHASESAEARRASSSGDGFEVVPQEASESGSDTDSEDEFDMLDDHGKAEVLALAKKMLRRRDKESIIDAAYNRFAFHDVGLPKWFQEDEARHMRPISMVSKSEVAEEKERLRAIDARPIKKVAEAKARKQMRVVKKMTIARNKATVIADQEDVPMKSKMREIEKVYAKARASTKGRDGKGDKGKKGKKGKGRSKDPMDNRLKKDKMDAKRQDRKAGKGKRGRK